MRRTVALLAAAAAACTALVTASPAQAATTQLARWEMNEGVGAKTMRDSSGRGRNGAVGQYVKTGQNGGSAYAFGGPTGADYDGRLVKVSAGASGLNPGSRSWELVVRLRTTNGNGNVLQKGQSGTPGGYYKMELNGGFVTCLFRAGNGAQSAATSSVRVNTGAFRTVVCRREGATTVVKVDGVVRGRNTGGLGSISNSSPFVLGGKLSCNPAAGVGCDYYSGLIDRVVVNGL